MSMPLLSSVGLRKGMLDVSFLNDGNSKNFYEWSKKVFEKVVINNEVWEQTKMMKHGPTKILGLAVNVRLPCSENIVRGVFQVSAARRARVQLLASYFCDAMAIQCDAIYSTLLYSTLLYSPLLQLMTAQQGQGEGLLSESL